MNLNFIVSAFNAPRLEALAKQLSPGGPGQELAPGFSFRQDESGSYFLNLLSSLFPEDLGLTQDLSYALTGAENGGYQFIQEGETPLNSSPEGYYAETKAIGALNYQLARETAMARVDANRQAYHNNWLAAQPKGGANGRPRDRN